MEKGIEHVNFSKNPFGKVGWASRWSFSPNSAWHRIETKTIGKTHPTLQMKFIKKLRKGDFEIKMENRSINVPIYSLSETYCTSFYVSMVPKLRPLNWTFSNSHFHSDFLKFCSHRTLRKFNLDYCLEKYECTDSFENNWANFTLRFDSLCSHPAILRVVRDANGMKCMTFWKSAS